MCNKKGKIGFNIIISFIVIIVITFSIIGFFVYSNWKNTLDRVVSQEEKDTNESILQKMDEFINEPLNINETNYNLFKRSILDINNKDQRDSYFAGVVEAHKKYIYSYSYGTESGEYYGARRNLNNDVEVIENNESTGGSSYYYSTTKDLTAGRFMEKTEKFDPRTRDWYTIAKEAKKPVFSPIYRHFVMNDLAISAAYPIYNNAGVLEGVLGTHITLSRINSFLKGITKDRKATAYIIERKSGELVANSLEKSNFQTLPEGKTKRISIGEMNNKSVSEAYERYKTDSNNNFVIERENDKFHVTITKFNREGLDWLIITSIPESQFTIDFVKSVRFSTILSAIALMLAIMIYRKNIELILKPIYDLINVTEKFSKGDFSYRARVFRNDEIGKLSTAFNNMADQLHNFINTLEDKVKERTIELEKINEEVIYLSYHDQLTGLYNRRYFDEELRRIDTDGNYPLTIIMADVNGLKLLNDSLGHAMGDELIKKAANIITTVCGKNGVVARIGGDEFVILLPSTGSVEVESILRDIKSKAAGEKVGFAEISIAFGYEVKTHKGEQIENILKKAEDNMYKTKLLQRPGIMGKTFEAIINNLNEKNKTEEVHSRKIADICVEIGKALKMNETDIGELKTAALLHDIGKIAIKDDILKKSGKLTEEELEQFKSHAEVGYRILNTTEGLSEISKYVLSHHERWDGMGYPKGLKGTEIPLQSRIIAIADVYEAMTRETNYRTALSKEVIIENLKKIAGTQIDPELVMIFIEKVL
ncbi:HD domain-containing phosphohydrolase [Clostridium magnum]|uniref:Cyclic di-GMP phosphodiesterase response regulator RpfG n=1 Tax=Clostridium magnum DSM 2767 TaxID=1121326 RepID=A0A162T9X5_9CLOT|nr:HD domain-containing phosphohydrolase [Clostridium magnum]KZL92394.1 cyclic di-GMP phosphodiesterase response regulator RpfG [Clostridium magnum DSM 2767]SHH10945.1 diguanylate cyclase (GGDEF) domain-containing protein [Clostridium magnum DSM 2767]